MIASFRNYPPATLERTWQSLFAMMQCVLEARADNDYRLPHVAKEKEGKYGKLEWKSLVKRGLAMDVKQFLRDIGIAK